MDGYLAHPVTGELIAVEERLALWRAVQDGRDKARALGRESHRIYNAVDNIIDNLVGADVVQVMSRRWVEGMRVPDDA